MICGGRALLLCESFAMRSGGGRGGREEGELAIHGHCKRNPTLVGGGQRGPKDGVTKNKKRQERCSTYGTGGRFGWGRVNQSRRDLENETGIGGVVAVIEAGGIGWQVAGQGSQDTEWTRQKVDN